MSAPLVSGSMRFRGVERYLGPRESVVGISRRHPVVLGTALSVWLICTVGGIGAALASEANAIFHLGQLGAALMLAGSLFFAWKIWQWWMARYVFTNQRILLIQGALARRVDGLPLRLVIDTTYRRTLGGRLLGYGDIELNLSGRPGLRTLTSLPNPDMTYGLVLALSQDGNGFPMTAVTGESVDGEPARASSRSWLFRFRRRPTW